MATTPNYDVIDDEKVLAQIETDKQAALGANDQTYKDMIDQADTFYQDQIAASQEWADKQIRLQQEQTDFNIRKIEQQKEEAHKDYLKEQSGAYVDWQKQSNEYGAEAEKMAAGGLDKTGYAESSQVSMYNTYQVRVAMARETINRTMIAFDNSIQEAKLQSSKIQAEIAYQAQKEQLALALEGFQYKNSLVLEQANRKLEIENMYHNQWKDALSQINAENSLAEDVRQYNESLLEEQRQYNESLEEEKRQYDASLLEEQRQYDASLLEEQRQYDAEMEYKNAALDEEKRQYNESLAWQKAQAAAKSPGSIGGGGGSEETIEKPESTKPYYPKTTKPDPYANAIKAGNTSNANSKYKSLATMSGQMSSKTGIANSIVSYAVLGKINTNEAAYLLDKFGYKVSDYLQ